MLKRFCFASLKFFKDTIRWENTINILFPASLENALVLDLRCCEHMHNRLICTSSICQWILFLAVSLYFQLKPVC